MVDEKNTQISEQPDIEQFYRVICGYVEYCIQTPKAKLTDTDKEGLSPSEIAKKEDDLKAELQRNERQKKTSQQAFDSMCSAIADGGIPHLSIYIDAAKKLYEEKADWKRDIKTMLVCAKSLRLFRNARGNLIDLYPLLMKVNKTFPVDDYSELSVAPKAALYGSEVNKTQKGSIKKSPLKNEDIQAMLDAFLQVKDNKRFGDWIMAILFFEPSRLVDGFQAEYIPEREKLKEWVFTQVDTNENYKISVMNAFLKENKLKGLLDAYIAKPVLLSKQAELESRIKTLEETNAKEKAAHDDQRAKQYAIIQERDASIVDLQQKVQDFGRCKQQLTDYINRYQIQLAMNERIVAENERRLNEMETDYDHMQNELAESTSRLESVEATYSALQSDFSLKNNELMRLKDIVAQKEETARVDVMRELVSGINEQFYYLTMFYLELKDTGKLNPESIELYADTLGNIDNVLMGLGIKKIGIIDQRVAYDASIHISTDAKIANGEQVMVSGYGWKIGDEVYIKAPVEKGE